MKQNDKFYSNKVWQLAIHICLSSYTYTYGASSMNSCTDNIGATLGWNGSYMMISIFTTVYFIGSVIGAIIGTGLSGRYGGRNIIIIGNVVFIIGSFICIIPSNYTFGIGRFITGIVGGVFITVPAVLINEITPDEMTGQVGVLMQIAMSFAFLSSYLFGLVVPLEDLQNTSANYVWMGIIFFPALICMYQIWYFARVFRCEFPMWLIKKNREDEARGSLRFVYTEAGVEIGMNRLMIGSLGNTGTESPLDSLVCNESPSYKDVFCRKKYRKMLRIAVFMNLGQQAAGVMAMQLYSTSMFENMGGGKFIARVYTVIIGVVNLVASVAGIPLIKRFGRKQILVVGEVLIIVDLLLLGIFTGFGQGGIVLKAFLIFFYFLVFIPSMASTYWAYIAEVLNEKCISIGITVNLVTIVTLSFLFPIANNFFGISSCFFVFCGFAFLLLIYEIVDLFETRGLTKKEIIQKVLSVE